MRKSTIIIAGGGTGGHLFPGVAVAEALCRLDPSRRIIFTISGSRENRHLKPYQLEVVRISSAPFYRGLDPRIFASLVITFLGLIQSLALIIRVRPEVVVGMGGYIAGPVTLAAYLRGVPSIICEQNAVPGLTNRLLARLADIVAVSFEDTPIKSKARLVVTGNPIREECRPLPKGKARARLGISRSKPVILVMGGSQGAHRINRAVIRAFETGFGRRYRFILQTGEADFSAVKEAVDRAGISALVRPFYERMGAIYGAADLALTRSGGGTFELLACGIPLILVPYPYAAAGHQTANALHWQRGGAAVVVKDREFDGERFAKLIDDLMADKGRLKRMAKFSRKMAHPHAAGVVAQLALELAGGEK